MQLEKIGIVDGGVGLRYIHHCTYMYIYVHPMPRCIHVVHVYSCCTSCSMTNCDKLSIGLDPKRRQMRHIV